MARTNRCASVRFGSALVACAALATLAASPQRADAADSDDVVVQKINELIRKGWGDNEVTPSERADDGEFARRVTLDVVGHIPSYDRLMELIEDDTADKRARYVDELLDEPAYFRYWTNIWGNLLVGRRNGFARDNLDRYLRRAIARNEQYDKFVFELVSASGASSDNPAVAFLAEHLNDMQVPATSITARLFLGMQVQCTQCHNHPFNDWKQEQFWSMNAFFKGSRSARDNRTNTAIMTDDPGDALVYFEKRNGLMQATNRRFVDGSLPNAADDERPRLQLAKLITDPAKPFLARAQVNRMWGHFFGFGFTKPIDDMGPHNPPSHPELLDYLAERFKESGYDNKRLIRWICASDAYNLTSRGADGNATDNPAVGATPLFSRMYVKAFSSEQLYDSLLIATEADKASGRSEDQAEKQRREWLQQFVRTFNTDENDETTTFNGTIPQALMMMNGNLTQTAINGTEGSFLKKLLDAPGGDVRAPKADGKKPRKPAANPKTVKAAKPKATRGIPAKIETLFLVTLARTPTEKELSGFNEVFQKSGSQDPITGLQDVFWALLNSNEFIINH